MKIYNNRQTAILDFIKKNPGSSSSSILNYLIKTMDDKPSRPTVLRDIDLLLNDKKIKKSGIRRGTVYFAAIDVEEYFAIDPDKRNLKTEYFNFDVWDEMSELFDNTELKALDLQNEQYRANKEKLSNVLMKKEVERLTIEFAWKSSKIEGNTYTLLDTERLIKDKIEAEGKDKDEAIMILNHKTALDFIFSDPSLFTEMSVSKIEHIHRLLTGGLEIKGIIPRGKAPHPLPQTCGSMQLSATSRGVLNLSFPHSLDHARASAVAISLRSSIKNGIRQRKVGITGTNYSPLDNEFQIKEALQKLVDVINSLKHPLEKALASVLLTSYIQPFEDGNKRTARTIGNALLLAYNYCPLSYRSADEIEYKKGMILFYEQNDFTYFKTIFIDQFEQAIKKYF